MLSSNEGSPSRTPEFGTLMLETPAAAGYRMPAEWEHHACCWMCWPSRAEQWADGLAGAQRTYAAIARAIRRFEPVRMVAEPPAVAAARAQCGTVIESSLCLEGGAIHTDGAGTVITTESVVLNPNRNPGITKAAAELELCRALGATRVVWLPGDPNFYIANGGIVMPRFGVSGDERARASIQAAFPDREVVQVDITQLACGGGGIHCITQQQPA